MLLYEILEKWRIDKWKLNAVYVCEAIQGNFSPPLNIIISTSLSMSFYVKLQKTNKISFEINNLYYIYIYTKKITYRFFGSYFHDKIFVEFSDNATNAKNVRFCCQKLKSLNGKVRHVRNVRITRLEIYVKAASL